MITLLIAISFYVMPLEHPSALSANLISVDRGNVLKLNWNQRNVATRNGEQVPVKWESITFGIGYKDNDNNEWQTIAEDFIDGEFEFIPAKGLVRITVRSIHTNELGVKTKSRGANEVSFTVKENEPIVISTRSFSAKLKVN